jgi:hypothetical protein
MDRDTTIGLGLFSIGLVGYGTGIYIAYPGRAFSITAVIVGIGLLGIAQQSHGGENP